MSRRDAVFTRGMMEAMVLAKVNWLLYRLSATESIHPRASPPPLLTVSGSLHSTVQFSPLAVSATAGRSCGAMEREMEMEMDMVMELSPPPGAGAAIDAKRERKRSRYLSPPYTDSEVKDGEEEPPPDVCAAEVLSALRAAALLSLDPIGTQALRFLTLYRRRKTLANPATPGVPLPAAGVGHNLTAAPGGSEKKKTPAAISKGNAAALDNSAPLKRRRNNKSSNGQKPNLTPPVPKLPLKDVRNNLHKMILSLTSLPQQGKPAMGNLVGQMQGLLVKVDRMLQGGASSTVHHN